jgi:hypothetical protein
MRIRRHGINFGMSNHRTVFLLLNLALAFYNVWPRNIDQGCAARLHLPLDEPLLDFGDSLGGVEALRAGRGAI